MVKKKKKELNLSCDVIKNVKNTLDCTVKSLNCYKLDVLKIVHVS